MRIPSDRHDVRSRISPKEKLRQILSASYSMTNVQSLLKVINVHDASYVEDLPVSLIGPL